MLLGLHKRAPIPTEAATEAVFNPYTNAPPASIVGRVVIFSLFLFVWLLKLICHKVYVSVQAYFLYQWGIGQILLLPNPYDYVQ